MPGRLDFVFPKESLPSHTGGALLEENSPLLNVKFAYSVVPDEYKFSKMGVWPVSFRASIPRIITFKMIGTGVVAFLMSINVNTGRYTAFSCTFCAGVNLIAAIHYWLICIESPQTLLDDVSRSNQAANAVAGQVREQKMLPEKWIAKMGRADPTSTAAKEQERHGKIAMFLQENATDGLR